ncbi:MAG: CoA-binding protein [Dehalococcoidia bacterium]
MKNTHQPSLDFLFNPNSITLAGITTAEGGHWTRTFLEGLIASEFDRPMYLVNPKGGEIKGHKVYTSVTDIPGSIDYVIGLVNAQRAAKLVEECAEKGARVVHFCTAGFSETGEEERIRLESELVEVAHRKGVRIIGPNCMGIYSPKSRMSFTPTFPNESGPVGVISQSGGNSIYIVRQAALRGVRFSKVVSYGNACDIDESDLLEYLADDADTEVLALYIEGIKDGRRFRRALEQATKKKPVIMLKGGNTEGGARAVAGHTAALAGSRAAWDALCKQLGIISVSSIEEMVDVLVTLLFLPLPKGRNAVLFGAGGGASVLITDEFENRGLRVPALPQEIVAQIREFTPVAGNILRNPVDYSQAIMNAEGVRKTLEIILMWEGTHFLVVFVRTGQFVHAGPLAARTSSLAAMFFANQRSFPKPVAVVLELSIEPHEADAIATAIRGCVASGLPVYYSFAAAANAINLILTHTENRPDHRLRRRLGL